MKKIMILLIIIICFPTFTFAGEIYGNIKIGRNPIGKGAKLEIKSDRVTPYVDYTDKYSSYSIYVKETGQCKLTVYYRDHSPSIIVYSYQGSVRYNLILIQSKGKYYIRRQ